MGIMYERVGLQTRGDTNRSKNSGEGKMEAEVLR